jgi:hypothetical protein
MVPSVPLERVSGGCGACPLVWPVPLVRVRGT